MAGRDNYSVTPVLFKCETFPYRQFPGSSLVWILTTDVNSAIQYKDTNTQHHKLMFVHKGIFVHISFAAHSYQWHKGQQDLMKTEDVNRLTTKECNTHTQSYEFLKVCFVSGQYSSKYTSCHTVMLTFFSVFPPWSRCFLLLRLLLGGWGSLKHCARLEAQ